MRILIIEPEKKIADFIKRGLEADHHEVEVISDGEEGFRKALNEAYKLVILDVILPTKDGLSIVRDLRTEKITAPVMILTAKSSVDDIVAGLEVGSDDYLAKPFALAELLARVRALLRRSGWDRGAEISFADLRLDPVMRKVWRKDREIKLAPREYSLLEFLMRNPDQPLTRATIADNVWTNSDFDKFTNIVDVYINYLRRKIDLGTDRKLIHTVRRAGYMLKEK
ncbi:MAG: response regulator transcription factor [Geobacteraceae bacterium]|nr:response regulator transcription factor [Geobacteraceae bacterium]